MVEIKDTKIKKSITLYEETITKLNNFTYLEELDFSNKIDIIANDYISIINISLKEIGKIFDTDEINILINACNMVILHTDKISPAVLIHNAVVLYGKEFNQNVSSDLENKILNLTVAQSYALLRVLQSIWVDSDYKRFTDIMK